MPSLLPILTAGNLGMLTFQPFPDVEPFTIRAGAAYSEIQYGIVTWIRDELVPYLQANDGQAVWDANAATLTTAVTDALTAVNWLYSLGQDNVFFAKAHGVTEDGVTDDSTALAALIATATALSDDAVIQFGTGATINLGTASLDVDVSKVRLLGDRTTLTGTGTLHLYSSTDYYSNEHTWKDALSGIVLKNLALTLGHATYTSTGKFRIRNGGMLGGTLTFLTNAWKIAFDLFHLQGTVVSSANPANTGEDMIFRDCMIGDGSNITFAGGQWHFDGCSLDNMAVTLSANAVASFDGCHFEDSGGQSKRIISISESGTTAFLIGCQLVLNPGSGDWTEAPFYVDPAVSNGGLIVQGLAVPRHTYFNPDTADKLRVLVAGGGTATFAGITTYDGSGNEYALGEAANLIANGDGEAGNANGWTGSGTGTYTNDTAVKNRGSKSHKLSAAATQNYGFYQEVPVTPGRKLWAQFWRAVTFGTGGALNSQINFFDRAGNQLSTYGYSSDTTAQTGFRSFITVVPKGAATAQLYFYLTGGSAGTAAVNIDDVIVNVA